ncbi:MAG: hypothetical protein COV52_05930 [Gammaproteobacteria bacterium CG11_big_fil_rev_8_21_14_0_20_46_22]|nr:MAG: hypothetical protein COW05_07730 [Gammaproteobacteria bacterium CG12_big_fil_rev_8_21_14_0_65_46_12]PIR11042.1 MAG: hypothetical protein COV52_05930 [Gammaproteobacteria bacterium CG11_big_fil_rev_8_21_14_0_20_46_22]
MDALILLLRQRLRQIALSGIISEADHCLLLLSTGIFHYQQASNEFSAILVSGRVTHPAQYTSIMSSLTAAENVFSAVCNRPADSTSLAFALLLLNQVYKLKHLLTENLLSIMPPSFHG